MEPILAPHVCGTWRHMTSPMLFRLILNETWFFISVSEAVLYHANFTLNEDSAMEGGEFFATCYVEIEEQKTFFVIWAKLLDDGSQHEVEIATNTHVNENFAKNWVATMPHYQLVEEGSFNKVKFFLAYFK